MPTGTLSPSAENSAHWERSVTGGFSVKTFIPRFAASFAMGVCR